MIIHSTFFLSSLIILVGKNFSSHTQSFCKRIRIVICISLDTLEKRLSYWNSWNDIIVSNIIIVMPGLEELTARYERINERIQDKRYMKGVYLINETKISYNIKDILDNWSNVTTEDWIGFIV